MDRQMAMKQIKVSEATGIVLDWLVARLENPEWWDDGYMDGDPRYALKTDDGGVYSPSTNWAQGGPIIERETINTEKSPTHTGWFAAQWRSPYEAAVKRVYADGPTPLIAAMRCYVVFKLGEEVEVPEELT